MKPGEILGIENTADRELGERQLPPTFQDELRALRAQLSKSDEPLAWLRDLHPFADDAELAVCSKGDAGAFPVYAVDIHLAGNLSDAGVAAAVRECARITAPKISDKEFAELQAANDPRYERTRGEMVRALNAYFAALL